MNWKLLVFILLIGYGAYQHFAERPIITTPGAMTQQVPVQTNTNQPAFSHRDYTITPLADFSIEARVLAKETYHFDRGARLSPIDLALGWGPMSDSAVLSQIRITQSNRFYYWRVEQFPIPREAIEMHSANMHMIPADSAIEAQLGDLHVGQLVKIEGYLVQANAKDGFTWKSSMTRNDTGAGACELVFVKKLISQ